MRRGTRVGQAYVAITADGTGINEEIVDSVDEAGPEIDKAGDRAGKRYGERFSARFRDHLDGLKGKIADRLNERLAEAGREAGARAGDEAGRSIVDKLEEHARVMGDRLSDRLSLSIDGNGDRMRRALNDTFGDDFANRLGDRVGDRIGESIGDRVGEALADVLDNVMLDVEEMIDRVRVSGNRGVGKRERSLGDRVGSLLGGGSRNNFLNAFGRGMGGLVDIVDRLRVGAGSLFSTFRKGFSEAQEGASFFQKTMSGFAEFGAGGGGGIAKSFSAIAASGPGAAVAIGVVAAAMAVLVSVVSALLALITALVSTIVSGLVGALAVAGAGVLALVAAGGLLTAAFMSMTDAQSALLKNAFQPLKAEMVGIAQVMLQDMVPAFQTWSTNLQNALVLALPVAEVLGKAFADAGSSLTAALSGPGFQQFSQMLASELPAIIENLSAALGGFLNGALSMFSAIMPFVTQFSIYLNDVAARFSQWAASAQGQNAIEDFVGRALTSLTSLWNFLGQFGGFLSDLLFSPQAQAAGNSIFDSMARSFEGFRQSLANAAADGSLKKWFDDAIKFGGSLWDVIQGLGDAFKSLSSSGVLSSVGTALSTLGEIFSGLSVLLGPIVDILGYVLPVTLGLALGPVYLLAKGIEWIGSVISDIVHSKAMQILLDAFMNLASGVLDKVAQGLANAWNWLKNLWNALGPLASFLQGGFVVALGAAVSPILAIANAVMAVSNAVGGLLAKLNASGGYGAGLDVKSVTAGNGAAAAAGGSFTNPSSSSILGLVNSGMNALNNTSVKSGGFKAPKQWKNPYTEWAQSLIKSGPTVAQQIKQAIRSLGKDASAAIRDATREMGGANVTSAMNQLADSFRQDGQRLVDAAQQGINSAAQRLASASTPKEAQKALRQVRRAQKAMQDAIRQQNRIRKAAAIIQGQGIQTNGTALSRISDEASMANLDALWRVQNKTLADFAASREKAAALLESANQKLADAIALRDDYAKQIANSIRDFGSLVSAQAQTINGVEQALTATDVTTNLQDRLTKIKKFQENLRLLLAQGLSTEAYKQLVEAGVEGGSATVDALVQGGTGAISEVNRLVDEISKAADGLGGEAANRMYQAGVDAAQGLVDGLTSLSGQLDAAATRLGNSIAAAVAKALGIKSPSRRLIAMMDEVGDGAVIGLDNQHTKVGNAASRLADQIAVSPEVAAHAARQGESATVFGNDDQKFRDLVVITPTEDPEAVAMEVLNEVTGAL